VTGPSAHRLAELGAACGPLALEAAGHVLVALIGLLVARGAIQRRRVARMAAGGTWFRLIPPPEADPDGGRVFWHTLQSVRRRGHPWVVWHFCAVQGQVGIWL